MTATLVLLRHGQSTWNEANLFTGWHDVPLTALGQDEARRAGRQMREAGIRLDKAHTSLLTRAVHTANLALEELDQLWLPVERHWRLNERHYGGLQGLDKAATAVKYGEAQVKVWRRSYDVPPPPLERDNPEHPCHDPRYARLAPDVLPASESLAMVLARVLPDWHDHVVPDLRAGLTVLVAAHGNSLRALMKHLEDIPEEEIVELNVATGVPRRYRFGEEMQLLGHPEDLGDPEAIAKAKAAVAAQGTIDADVPEPNLAPAAPVEEPGAEP